MLSSSDSVTNFAATNLQFFFVKLGLFIYLLSTVNVSNNIQRKKWKKLEKTFGEPTYNLVALILRSYIS